jgi:hypothetical protein
MHDAFSLTGNLWLDNLVAAVAAADQPAGTERRGGSGPGRPDPLITKMGKWAGWKRDRIQLSADHRQRSGPQQATAELTVTGFRNAALRLLLTTQRGCLPSLAGAVTAACPPRSSSNTGAARLA